MSRLGLGLGITKGGVVPFNPLSLDPYLLYESDTSMRGTLEGYTLDLDPATPSSLDVITASRTGVATYTDADGLIQTAAADTVRVDYTQGEQLTPTKFQNIGYTDFSSGRVLSNFGTGVIPVLSLDALGSPNGTEDAYKIVFNAGSGTTSGDGSELYFNVSEIEDNIQSTASIFLRGENGGEQLVFRGASNGSYQLVTLTTEWQRFTTTENTNPSGNQKLTFGIRQSVSGHGVINSAATIYAYGPQLEEGTTASDFVANTTGIPKFTGISATYAPRVPMILVEPSSVNLVPYSEDFSNSAWSKSNTTVTSNESTSPDGLNNASLVTVNSAAISHVRDFFPISAAAHTFSIYAKAGTTTDIQLYVIEQGVGSGTADVNIQSGVVTNVSSEWNGGVTTENIGNGWFRIKGTRTFTTSASNHGIGVAATGQNGLNFYIWGAQVETESVATSYIPTAGGDAAARTRAADDLVISGSDFDFYNQTEGTFYCEFQTKDATAFYYLLNSQSEQARFFYSNGGTNTINSFDGTTALGLTNLQDNTLSRVALSIKASEFQASKDGSSEAVEPHNGNLLTVPTELRIGKSPYNGVPLQLNGHIKRLIYWPTHSDSL